MLSHELRNPLAPIKNSLYLLDRVDPAGPQARRAKQRYRPRFKLDHTGKV